MVCWFRFSVNKLFVYFLPSTSLFFILCFYFFSYACFELSVPVQVIAPKKLSAK